MRRTVAPALGAFVLALSAQAAGARNCVGRPDFDACMARIMQGNQARLAESQRSSFAACLGRHGPWLRRQYAAYRGPPMPFERFAYHAMMTANGTNVAGGLQAQRDAFAGQPAAQATREESYRSYRQGMDGDSARMDRAAERFDRNVVRGNVARIDPASGRKIWVPHAVPEGRAFTQDGQTYVRGSDGHHQWNGNGWTPMRAAR